MVTKLRMEKMACLRLHRAFRGDNSRLYGCFYQEKNDEKLRWRIASKKKNQFRGTPLY